MKYWPIFLILILSACTTEAPAPTAQPTLRWERSPYTVVFRAETVNSQIEEFVQRSAIPTCSVYGDNRLVYVIARPDGTFQVAWDVLSDAVVTDFATALIGQTSLATLTTGIDALPTGVSAPEVQQVYLAVNDRIYRADSLGGWPADFYNQVLDRCKGLSASPAEFAPDSAYVAVREIEYQSFLPSVTWDNPALSLDSLVNAERTWLSGEGVSAIWQILRESGESIQFQEGEKTYQVILEIPGVTRGSPPPP
jgi:hypothetical protein